MKKLFDNSQGCNTAQITVSTQGRTLDLYYHLNDNPVQHQWQQFHKDASAYKLHPMAKLTIEQVEDILVDLCTSVDEDLQRPVTQEQLNKLHNKFVEHQESEPWKLINQYIHIAEGLLTDKFAEFNSIITFTVDPEPQYVPLKEEHKLWLVTDEHWGDLLLGYATIGKDWIDIARNNDDLTDLNVQSTISPETCMFFHVEQPCSKNTERMFYKWAQGKDIPFDLNSLSLGRYYLGKLIITEDLLKFNPTVSDWYMPNHKCKLEWNRTIGSDVQITNIRFFDSDLYLYTLLEHTGLTEYA
jgi:hypothetical protein